MRSLLAIANADAGTSNDESVKTAVEVLGYAYDVELVETSSPADLTAALAERPDLHGVVVLGGDGSLNAVVEALRTAGRLSLAIGLVPLGTGNDFAATLGLPDDPERAAEVIVDGVTRSLDLIIDGDGQVVVNAAHIGIGAEAAVAARPLKKSLGPIGYVLGAGWAGLRGLTRPGARLEIRVDGEVLPRKTPVIQLAVGNGRFVGGGAPLLPRADPADGLIDVAVSYTASALRRISYARSISRGEHHERDDVVYLTGTEITVTGDALPCTSDGELSEARREHSWRIEPGVLTVYTP